MNLLKYTLEMKWAIFFNVIFLAWMVFERVSGWHDTHIHLHQTRTNLFAIPAILMYLFALLDFKRDAAFLHLPFKTGFLFGFRTTLFITVLSPFMQLIVSYVITPHFFDNAIQYSVSSGYFSLPEAEAYFNIKSYLMMSVIGSLIMGIATSALVSGCFSLFQLIKNSAHGKVS